MGFMLPSPTSPAEHARVLMARKDTIEAEIDVQRTILTANGSTLSTPLIDADGFPRADIDIWAVRHARVRIIELRNDLKDIMDDIARALQGVYDPALRATGTAEAESQPTNEPFAKVNGVLSRSPAATAGLQAGDLVLKFGPLTKSSFPSDTLQPLAEHVAANENREIRVQVLRGEQPTWLNFTPRKGWGGRGMLGCHIVPYSA